MVVPITVLFGVADIIIVDNIAIDGVFNGNGRGCGR